MASPDESGTCYLNLFKEPCRGLASAACGRWPTVRTLFAQPAGWFVDSPFYGLEKVAEGRYHLKAEGSEMARAMMVLPLEQQWPEGSFGALVATDEGKRGLTGVFETGVFLDDRVGGLPQPSDRLAASQGSSRGGRRGVGRPIWFGDGVTLGQKLSGEWRGAGVADEDLVLEYYDHAMASLSTSQLNPNFDGYCYVIMFSRERVRQVVGILGPCPTWAQLLHVPADWYRDLGVLQFCGCTQVGDGKHHVSVASGTWSLLSVIAILTRGVGYLFEQGSMGRVVSGGVHASVRQARDVPGVGLGQRVGGCVNRSSDVNFLPGGGFSVGKSGVSQHESGLRVSATRSPTAYSYVPEPFGEKRESCEPCDCRRMSHAFRAQSTSGRDSFARPLGNHYASVIGPGGEALVSSLGPTPTLGELLVLPAACYLPLCQLRSFRVRASSAGYYHLSAEGDDLVQLLMGVTVRSRFKYSDCSLAASLASYAQLDVVHLLELRAMFPGANLRSRLGILSSLGVCGEFEAG